ncbi:MAG: LysR family transcriptional regulator [Rhodospirillaceae bacterium]
MEMQQLKRFLVLTETKNFHAAAEILNMTQPALSQSIKKLEDSVGEPLFLRSSRGVEITESGTLLIPRAKLILKLRTDFENDLENVQERRNAKISIGVAPYFTRRLIPEALNAFLEKQPDVLIDVSQGRTVELVEALQHGAIDMAFCSMWPALKGDADICFEKIYEEQFSVFARSDHPIFKGTVDPVSQLNLYPWAVHDREMIGAHFARKLQEKGFSAPKFPVATLSLQIIMSLVCTSDHIAVISNDFAREELKLGKVRAIPTDLIQMEREDGIVTLKDAPKSRALRAFIDELRCVCHAK